MVREDNRATAFVTGYPIKHSLSPYIHQYWLQKYKIEGDYKPIAVAPEDFKNFMKKLAEGQYLGGNVTIPHKETAFQCADFTDDIAKKIGAANTLWHEKGKIYASNSDAYGFAANLDDFANNWCQDIALVLGAGGAARAVIYALLERGFSQIILANRTLSRAEDVAKHFGKNIIACDWNHINHYIDKADFLVNTTSIGMALINTGTIAETVDVKGKEYENTLNIDWSKAKAGLIVTDIVYTPLNTLILQQAQKHGLKTIDGIGMLLHQAVPGFLRWFGQKPKVDKELRQHILKIMGNI